jgi:hypothetical protein
MGVTLFIDNAMECYDQKPEFADVATSDMLTHLRRKLMQAVWLVLLDADFIHAYIHGLELNFIDDDPYLFFPRFFTDSADYPEKYVAFFRIYLLLIFA